MRRRLRREEGRLDWRRPAARARARGARAHPAPGAWFEATGERIKVLAAERSRRRRAAPGTVLDGALAIACGEGALRLLRLQRAGPRAGRGRRGFLRGFAVADAGTVLPCPATS